MGEWIDLGGEHRYKRFRNGGGNNVAGVILEFADGCRAACFFKGKGIGHPEWEVLQEEPLTLHPSIQIGSPEHRHHGWIRDGRWQDE